MVGVQAVQEPICLQKLVTGDCALAVHIGDGGGLMLCISVHSIFKNGPSLSLV